MTYVMKDVIRCHERCHDSSDHIEPVVGGSLLPDCSAMWEMSSLDDGSTGSAVMAASRGCWSSFLHLLLPLLLLPSCDGLYMALGMGQVYGTICGYYTQVDLTVVLDHRIGIPFSIQKIMIKSQLGQFSAVGKCYMVQIKSSSSNNLTLALSLTSP